MSQPRCADGHERRADGRVAVRVELHRRADDVGDLVEAAVVHVPERVQDAALHRLQAVVDVRHRAVEDDVAGVVEEPVAVGDGERRLFVLNLSATSGGPRWREETRRGGCSGSASESSALAGPSFHSASGGSSAGSVWESLDI